MCKINNTSGKCTLQLEQLQYRHQGVTSEDSRALDVTVPVAEETETMMDLNTEEPTNTRTPPCFSHW